MLMKYEFKRSLAYAIFVLVVAQVAPLLGIITNDSQVDPYPIFTTLDPQTFLQTREKLRLKCFDVDRDWDEWIGFSITPFAQNSNSTRNDCLVTPPFTSSTDSTTISATPCTFTCTDKDQCLGNINGRWSMLGLLLGPIPDGHELAPSLQQALTALQSVNSCPVPETGLTPQYIDKFQQTGFFDVPMRYKKRGVRFDLKAMFTCNAGFSFNMGLADISQTIGFYDRTERGIGPACILINGCVQIDPCTLERYLMENLETIGPEIGLCLTDFHKFSVEDLRAGLFWRSAYQVNTNSKRWEQFLIIPFLHLEASLPVGAKRDFNKFTSLSFGSNDHFGFGFTTGLNVDFTKTIEIGGEFGCTHFFKRDICSFAVPNSKYQMGIFPFRTAVSIQPGNNWHFGLKMQAYHFLGDLSFYFQYMLVDHMRDKIRLKQCEEGFVPEVLENISSWKAQMANIGFNYDISPDVSLGFLWQTPFPSVRTYRATTVMVSFNAQF